MTVQQRSSTPVRLLLVAPPLSQLNTPYPATAYLVHALRRDPVTVEQADIGIELVQRVFSRTGLKTILGAAGESDPNRWTDATGVERFLRRAPDYINTVEVAMRFLAGGDETLAHRIVGRTLLPEGERFGQADHIAHLFGTMGTRDFARYLATLYLQDITDFIRRTVAPHFSLSRYGESLAVSAREFGALHQAAQARPSVVDVMMMESFAEHMRRFRPTLVGFSVPFPGNFYAALRLAHAARTEQGVRTILGGGYVNTELRQLRETLIFDYFNYITLDDGEAPLKRIVERCSGQATALCRTYTRTAGEIRWHAGLQDDDDFEGLPDYRGLPLSSYLSMSDSANPMQRLWSDGLWNKITLAHGCYWARCSFCDIELDYIARYQELQVTTVVDGMQRLMQETGSSGFHFVDEAAPPDLLRRIALEILRRGLVVSWWANIRFEKGFGGELCRLLSRSGCIAVSGGLEVASDRLLRLMKKGTSIAQVTRVARNFAEHGVLVHAYLMYGFPTETAQETIDALEVVRQLFVEGVVHSAFWHRFALTAHSGIAQQPTAFGLKILPTSAPKFAHNEIDYAPLAQATDHGRFSHGLSKSLLNYLHGIDLDKAVGAWFDFDTPATTLSSTLIRERLAAPPAAAGSPRLHQLVWLGALRCEGSREEAEGPVMHLSFGAATDSFWLPEDVGAWLMRTLPRGKPGSTYTLSQWRRSYEASTGHCPAELEESELWSALSAAGMLWVRARHLNHDAATG